MKLTCEASVRLLLEACIRVELQVSHVDPIMRFFLSTLISGAACIGLQADAIQFPLQYSSHIPSEWDFFEKPSQNSTSHLIFDTANSFLQHWTNTRYRNGGMIISVIPLL